jgi:hypothetical protein
LPPAPNEKKKKTKKQNKTNKKVKKEVGPSKACNGQGNQADT